MFFLVYSSKYPYYFLIITLFKIVYLIACKEVKEKIIQNKKLNLIFLISLIILGNCKLL